VYRIQAICAVALLLAGGGLAAQTQGQLADPLVGKWALNVAKSKYFTGTPNVRASVVVYEPIPGGVKGTQTDTRLDGTQAVISATNLFDGQPRPLTGVQRIVAGKTCCDNTVEKRIDRFTTEVTQRAGDSPLRIAVRTVSKDLQVITRTWKELND
jgi:hypothetical protein